jgi:hypothetical protein
MKLIQDLKLSFPEFYVYSFYNFDTVVFGRCCFCTLQMEAFRSSENL